MDIALPYEGGKLAKVAHALLVYAKLEVVLDVCGLVHIAAIHDEVTPDAGNEHLAAASSHRSQIPLKSLAFDKKGIEPAFVHQSANRLNTSIHVCHLSNTPGGH